MYLPAYPVNGKEKEKEAKLFIFAERQASGIIDEMEKRYEKDLELYQRKQLACRKLTYLDDLAKQLKNVREGSRRCTSARSFWSRTDWEYSRSG